MDHIDHHLLSYNHNLLFNLSILIFFLVGIVKTHYLIKFI